MRIFKRRKSSLTYILFGSAFVLGVIWYLQWGSESISVITDEVMRVRVKRFMQYQKSEAFRSGPGERGEAVVLLGEEKTKAAALIPKEAFNRIASDKISLERSIPDVRDPE